MASIRDSSVLCSNIPELQVAQCTTEVCADPQNTGPPSQERAKSYHHLAVTGDHYCQSLTLSVCLSVCLSAETENNATSRYSFRHQFCQGTQKVVEFFPFFCNLSFTVNFTEVNVKAQAQKLKTLLQY